MIIFCPYCAESKTLTSFAFFRPHPAQLAYAVFLNQLYGGRVCWRLPLHRDRAPSAGSGINLV